MKMKISALLLMFLITKVVNFIPPKFEWKILDFAWRSWEERQAALASGDYVPQNNLPTGLARWRDKLFITIPRWKQGVPSSLNYININDPVSPPLHPYPSWEDAFVRDTNPRLASDATVVSTFRIHVDKSDRLWVIDNGITDIMDSATQVDRPAVVLFDLKTDKLIGRYRLPDDVLREDSAFTSIVVDIPEESPNEVFAYMTDMVSNAIVVFHLNTKEFWRVEHPYFDFEPDAGVYNIAGDEFYWSDGISACTLSKTEKDGQKYLYLTPTSSTKQFRMSTKLLRNKHVPKELLADGVEMIGDRGPRSQVTACDYDPKHNLLFFTQMCKNGVGCWNLDKTYDKFTTPLILSDCNLMEFPNDVKVDNEGHLWILSDRQTRFLFTHMDFNDVNFRIFSESLSKIIQGTACEQKVQSDKLSMNYAKILLNNLLSGNIYSHLLLALLYMLCSFGMFYVLGICFC